VTKEALAVSPKVRTVIGSRPLHTHSDPETNEKWACNSPYCSELEMAHPDNGGPAPIVQGYEPWRR